MHLAHWGLSEPPFSGRLRPRVFHQSPIHEEALARLHFLVEQDHRLGIVLGGPGTGKSVLLGLFAEQLRRAGRPVASLSLVGVDPDEFPWLLAGALGLNLDRMLALPLLWRMVCDRLAEFRYQQLHAVLVVDHVEHVTAQVARQLLRLAKHDPSPEWRFTMVLAGRQEAVPRLGPELAELVELWIELGGWDPADTEQYVRTSLVRAGCSAPVFDAGAVARLHELAGGLPRRVAHLADLALVAAAGRDLQQVDADTVESVCRELTAATSDPR